jgi:hypothetical protein
MLAPRNSWVAALQFVGDKALFDSYRRSDAMEHTLQSVLILLAAAVLVVMLTA